MTDIAIIAIRWALYIDLGLLFGLPLFALYALGGHRIERGYLPIAAMIAILALIGAVLSVVGFAIQAASMAGLPLLHPDFALLRDLLGGTALGTALQVRLAALLVLLLCAALYDRAPRAVTITAGVAGALALGTLAWSGHGAAGEGNAGWVQLAADLVHLLAAGAWLSAIAAFFTLVAGKAVTADIQRVRIAALCLRGFAITGTVLVGLLFVTGIGNGIFLIGPAHIPSLWQSTYGLLLLLKLVLFAAMLGLAALNRYRLTPALSLAIEQRDTRLALQVLRRSLLIEGGLAVTIFGLVAWLGTLAPPISS